MKLLPLLLGAVLCPSALFGATVISYTPTADPNLNPDAVDNFGNAVDVWQCTLPGSGSFNTGSFLADNPPTWAMYSVSDQASAAHLFEGGALTDNQTVSIDFANAGVSAGHMVGINLSSGGAVVFSLYFIGNGPGTYSYADANAAGQSTGVNFSYYGTNTLSFTLTSSTTYQASFGGQTWTGVITAAPDTIEVFNDAHQNTSDNQVYFKNLAITAAPVPEPGSVALLVVGMVGVLFFRRRPNPAS